ncbi:MAG: terpene cyclase/mutase family protein [Pirellulaceae bacterium]|nr:terpene cyclase/mutase family protein [Pirellulaceae bacterium]
MQETRREFNRLVTGGALAVAAAPVLGWSHPNLLAQTQDQDTKGRKNSPNEKSPAELITPEARRVIDKGLAFLDSRQVKAAGRNRGAFGTSGYSAGVATCGLAGLAFMCGGHTPGQGRYGKNVDLCVEFLMNNVADSGYISRTDNLVHENMYGHGFAMLFLSQAYGMTRKAELGDKLRKAVELTCKTQNDQGGWRYQPVKSDADLSITVCQIMGLRGSRDSGIDVPDKVREKCIEYVKKSQNNDGSFRYTMQGGHTTFAMTAAGVTSLYSAGIYEGEQVEKALKNLKNSGFSGMGGHYFYSHYYAVQAMWHAGGEYWNDWYPRIRDELIRNQAGDGSWANSEAGPEFGAAMACIILQIPLNLVPVFSP